MGRETKNFRQTRSSGTADYANKSYARVNRAGSWNIVNRISNIISRKNKSIIDKS